MSKLPEVDTAVNALKAKLLSFYNGSRALADLQLEAMLIGSLILEQKKKIEHLREGARRAERKTGVPGLLSEYFEALLTLERKTGELAVAQELFNDVAVLGQLYQAYDAVKAQVAAMPGAPPGADPDPPAELTQETVDGAADIVYLQAMIGVDVPQQKAVGSWLRMSENERERTRLMAAALRSAQGGEGKAN